MPETIYVCGKCGRHGKASSRKVREEWLIVPDPAGRPGDEIIRCGDCREEDDDA